MDSTGRDTPGARAGGAEPGDDRRTDGVPVDDSGAGAARSAASSLRLFHVPAGTPFLPTLVDALCTGALVPGFSLRPDDPLRLADATIYVPTRRATRELRAAFVTSLSAGGTARAALLPTIRALGDVDDEAGFFDEATPESLLSPPVIGDMERVVELSKLVLAWIRRLPDHLAGLHEGGRIEVPSSPADAVWLARDLAALMDEMESQGTDWGELISIDPGEQAQWWQLTTEFLRIVTESWPGVLESKNRSNRAQHRNAATLAEAGRLARGGAAGPVIVATSPNLGPAQSELARVVAGLPQGAVVLPGLDVDLDERGFRALCEGFGDGEPVRHHAQYGHARLLRHLGARPADARPLGTCAAAAERRARVVSEAMRPSADTHRWIETASGLDDPDCPSLSEAVLIETPGPREEALAIAAALRGAIEEPGATAALVTPDRKLARRVAAELRRFGIEADDSAGRPLLSTAPGTLLRLALAAALDPGEPYALLGLLKHPLARFGMKRSAVRRATLAIELIALRSGAPGRIEVERLGEMFEARLAAIEDDPRKPFWRMRFGEEALAEARALIAAVQVALDPLAQAERAGRSHPPSVWAGLVAHTLDTVGADAEGRHDRIYGDEAGAALARELRAMMAVEDARNIDMTAAEMVPALDALLDGVPVRAAASGHPRVAILGLIESRLLSPGTVVLGGLNEGGWPSRTTTDQFLSRPMRDVLSLEPPERRVGLEAYDFAMMCGAERLVLTRALKADGAPTTPSRWLQRLEAVVPRTVAAMRARGEDALAPVLALDAEPGGAAAAAPSRPAPVPPVEARPNRLSVTEIETLLRDPYAFYARRILALEPLAPPRAEPGPAERGTLFHAILERFVVSGADPGAPGARAALDALAREAFEDAGLPPGIHALWWPRYEGFADRFLRWEAERRAGLAAIHVEARASLEVEGVRITGYADRIDVAHDGRIEIIDYKTGTEPSAKQARQLLSPQLALEAALAARGGFAALGEAREARSLAYVRLRPGEDAGGKAKFAAERIETDRGEDAVSAAMLADRAFEQLRRLLARYRDPATPYPSRVMPFREAEMDGAYDHLARVREWSTGSGGEDDGDEGDGGDDA